MSLGRPLGAYDAVVRHAVHLLQAHFLEGGYVGQRGHALRRRHHQAHQVLFLDEVKGKGQVVKNQRHLACRCICQRRVGPR